MKKKIFYLFIVIVSFFVVSQNVYAEDYKINTLIPVNTPATVETDKFDYKNFIYDTNVDAKGNATLRFEGIQNNTLSKTAVSINVLLFDENKKNIGFLTYCTDKDVNSDNSGFKIRANQVVPFNISVTKRYLIEGKEPKDVRYIAVRDENRYCQIGGYSNYKDLTIEEIMSGKQDQQSDSSFHNLSSIITPSLIKIVIIIMVVIGMLFGLIKLLQMLKEKGSINGKKNLKQEVYVGSEKGNKPIDLGNFYNSSQEKSILDDFGNANPNGLLEDENSTSDIDNNLNLDTSNNSSIEDIFNGNLPDISSNIDSTSSASSLPELDTDTSNVEQSTQAVAVDDLYNSINENDEEQNNDSVDNIYNSISGDDNNRVSVDDLYESINVDDDSDDDNNNDD